MKELQLLKSNPKDPKFDQVEIYNTIIITLLVNIGYNNLKESCAMFQ